MTMSALTPDDLPIFMYYRQVAQMCGLVFGPGIPADIYDCLPDNERVQFWLPPLEKTPPGKIGIKTLTLVSRLRIPNPWVVVTDQSIVLISEGILVLTIQWIDFGFVTAGKSMVLQEFSENHWSDVLSFELQVRENLVRQISRRFFGKSTPLNRLWANLELLKQIIFMPK